MEARKKVLKFLKCIKYQQDFVWNNSRKDQTFGNDKSEPTQCASSLVEPDSIFTATSSNFINSFVCCFMYPQMVFRYFWKPPKLLIVSLLYEQCSDLEYIHTLINKEHQSSLVPPSSMVLSGWWNRVSDVGLCTYIILCEGTVQNFPFGQRLFDLYYNITKYRGVFWKICRPIKRYIRSIPSSQNVLLDLVSGRID